MGRRIPHIGGAWLRLEVQDSPKTRGDAHIWNIVIRFSAIPYFTLFGQLDGMPINLLFSATNELFAQG
jgi:hypothetical protein